MIIIIIIDIGMTIISLLLLPKNNMGIVWFLGNDNTEIVLSTVAIPGMTS